MAANSVLLGTDGIDLHCGAIFRCLKWLFVVWFTDYAGEPDFREIVRRFPTTLDRVIKRKVVILIPKLGARTGSLFVGPGKSPHVQSQRHVPELFG